MSLPEDDPLLTLGEFAVLTETPIDTVRGWVKDQRLEVERVGPRVLRRVRVRQSVMFRLFPHLHGRAVDATKS